MFAGVDCRINSRGLYDSRDVSAGQAHALHQDLSFLLEEEQRLDNLLETARSVYKHMLNSERMGYVINNDLRSIDALRDQTLILVKAPANLILQTSEQSDSEVSTVCFVLFECLWTVLFSSALYRVVSFPWLLIMVFDCPFHYNVRVDASTRGLASYRWNLYWLWPSRVSAARRQASRRGINSILLTPYVAPTCYCYNVVCEMLRWLEPS